jgi:hypothetical protein
MARFFFYDELIHLARTPVEDIQWLAGQIAHLPPFAEGSAVLCGSVSWGKQSWRSDLDVAHFSTIEHPHLNQLLEDVIQQYLARTHNKFITPRFDVITIGAESISLVTLDKGISASAVSGGVLKKKNRTSDTFMETAVLFADHIGSIANLKGDPWRAFLDRYLSPVDKSKFDQRQALKSYVGRMTTEWSQQPLHQLNMDPKGGITAQQLDLLSKSENYPINLMRRILGVSGRYPSPDRASDVRAAFSMLAEPWAQTLLAQFEPFFSIEEKYEGIVAACQGTETPLSVDDYHEQLRSLFVALPFVEIQNIIWEYVGS